MFNESNIIVLFFLSLCISLGAQGIFSTGEQMERQGLVNVQSVDSTIRVSLMYARADNFTGRKLYANLFIAWLHPEAATALAQAQRILRRLRPDLSLKVYDAARPMSVQQLMWNAVVGTPQQNYVSNPKNGGGLHNYGLAVDITLCDAAGDTLTMGTKIDHLGARAHTNAEKQLVAQKKLSQEAYNNRQLLRKIMQQAGFHVLASEWWHFNYKTRAEAKAHYPVIR